MFHSITAYLITYISPQARTTQLINQMNCWIEFFFAAIFPFTDEQVFVKLSTKVTNCKTLKTISSTTQITQIILGWVWCQNEIHKATFQFWFSSFSRDSWLEMVRVETNNCLLGNLNNFPFVLFSPLSLSLEWVSNICSWPKLVLKLSEYTLFVLTVSFFGTSPSFVFHFCTWVFNWTHRVSIDWVSLSEWCSSSWTQDSELLWLAHNWNDNANYRKLFKVMYSGIKNQHGFFFWISVSKVWFQVFRDAGRVTGIGKRYELRIWLGTI